ncbi:retrovirus-related pol polyprotein from transposon TNT 1-94 [Tanacetum coccineum]
MSRTIPPIPPPFGASFGNSGSLNVNRVDTMPVTTDPINTTNTTNVSQSVVDENLPQLIDLRGGCHVTNVPIFDKEDFTSWKVRFLVFLDGLEPYLLKTLEDGPFVPMSSLSTSENPLPKPKEMWNDLILAHEGPSDTRDTKIAALRLKVNAFKSLESEKVNGTFTRLKCLLNDLENNGVTIPQAKDSDSDVEEDQRTNNEFMGDLNAEYHERALLPNQKRFYKRSGRVRSARKPLDKTKETCFACGKLSHFQKDCPSHKTSTPSYPSSNNSFKKSRPYTPSFNQKSSQNSGNHQKDYKGKYKGLKAKMVVLTKRIGDMTKEKSEKGKKDKEKSEKGLAFMVIAEDEPSVGKADARLGQWVGITMKKVHKLLSMTDGDERKHVLDYTHVDLHYVEDQRKNLICSKVTLDQLLSEQVPGNIIKALGGKGRRKEKISSKEVVFTKADESSSMLAPEISSDSESECDSQEPLPPLPKLIGATPSGTSESLISLSDLTLNMADLTLDTHEPKKAKPSAKVVSKGKLRSLKASLHQAPSQVVLRILSKRPGLDHFYPGCKVCGSIAHEASDCPKKHPNSRRPRIANRKSEPTKKYSKESGPKVVFGDDSSGDTEGYGSVNCNGITFTRVAYVNGLKHNLISISQLCDANYKVLFTKTQGTIYNQNDEVVLIAPRRRDVYVIDMSSFNKESNACFFAKASPSVNWLWH